MARIVPQGVQAEQEPNDAAKPQTVTLPAYVSGRLSEAKDSDAFRFEAKKGGKFEIRVAARAIGSQLDAVLRVLAADGKQLAQADDVKESRDAVLTFAVPSDGAYTVEVGDLHRRGVLGSSICCRSSRPNWMRRFLRQPSRLSWPKERPWMCP